MAFVIETTALRKTYETGRTARAGDGRQDASGAERTGIAALEVDGFVAFPALRIARGGLVAITGESGVGKSTLLNLLAGLDRPEPASVGAPCRVVLKLGEGGSAQEIDIVAEHARIPRHRIGFMFQQGHLLPNVPVAMNIALPSLVHQAAMARLGRAPMTDARVAALMRELNLDPEEHARKRAWQLSGGQAQRVAFARAIAHDPDLVFADEPTSSLDEANAYVLMTWLRRWIERDPRRTVLWVTHHRQLAADMADAVLDLRRYDATEIADAVVSPVANPARLDLAELERHIALGRPKPEVCDTSEPAPAAAGEVDGGPAGAAAGGSASEIVCAPAAPARPVAGWRIGRRLALSELFSRRGALANARRQRPLSARLAHVPGSPGRAPSAVRAWPAMIAAYADWRTTLILLLSSLLLFVAIAGGLVNFRLAERALSDPLACRLEIAWREGQAQRPFPRSEVDKLATRPWSAASADEKRLRPPPGFDLAPADCRTGPAAFGGIIEVNWGLGAIIDGVCQPERIESRLLVTPRNDPMLRRVAIVAGEGSGAAGKPRTIYDQTFDKSRFSGDDIYITADRYELLQSRLKDRLAKGAAISELCLAESQDDSERAARFPFRLAGVIDDLPTIGTRRANVLVPDAVYQRWVTDQGGKPKSYEKATLYFHPFDYRRVKDTLTPAPGEAFRYHYSTEELKRVQDRVFIYVATLASIVVLCLMLASIFYAYLRSWLEYYMEINAKPLSVLAAFGVEPRILRTMVLYRTTQNLQIGLVVAGLVAAVTVAVFVGVAWLARERRDLLGWLPIELDSLEAVSGFLAPIEILASVAATLVVVVAIIRYLASRAVNAWYRRNRYVASNLA